MDANGLQFLKDLLNTPSPSGYEQSIQKVVRAFAQPFAHDIKTDWHGNVIAAVNPQGYPRIMLAGHCDQIGLLVKYIDDQGFVWCEAVGGWDVQMLIGQNMVIWGKQGPVKGVIARKAVHLLTPEEKKVVPEIKYLWIDIGASSKSDASHHVQIGDPITFELGLRELRNGLAAAPGMDDKVGTWVVMNALRLVALSNPSAAVYAVSTVQEEIGLRGAITSGFSVDAQLGIAVDVTHATDCPTLDKKQHGDIKVGQGPVVFRGPNVNPVAFDLLNSLATSKQIPIQINSIGKPAGNDANAMQLIRGGQATAIVAIPNRYMHSPVEVIALSDLENAAQLIAAYCLSLTPTSDFTP